MSEKKQGSSSEDRTMRADLIRPVVKKLLEGKSLRHVEKGSGVSRSVLHDFLELNRAPQEGNLRRIEEWASRECGEKGVSEAVADHKEAAPELNGDGCLLDRWGYQRAKAIADLAELLREDTPILSMRAEAALNVSRAALIEARPAPDATAPPNAELGQRYLRAAAEVRAVLRRLGLDEATWTEGPEPPGQSESGAQE